MFSRFFHFFSFFFFNRTIGTFLLFFCLLFFSIASLRDPGCAKIHNITEMKYKRKKSREEEKKSTTNSDETDEDEERFKNQVTISERSNANINHSLKHKENETVTYCKLSFKCENSRFEKRCSDLTDTTNSIFNGEKHIDKNVKNDKCKSNFGNEKEFLSLKRNLKEINSISQKGFADTSSANLKQFDFDSSSSNESNAERIQPMDKNREKVELHDSAIMQRNCSQITCSSDKFVQRREIDKSEKNGFPFSQTETAAVHQILYYCHDCNKFFSVSIPHQHRLHLYCTFCHAFAFSQSHTLAETYRFCVFCNAFVTKLSSHCHICGRCVCLRDHHCPWINTCVGKRNRAAFLAFLFATAALCLHFAIVCCLLITETAKRYLDYIYFCLFICYIKLVTTTNIIELRKIISDICLLQGMLLFVFSARFS